MSESLYDLTERMLEIDELLSEAEGELTPEVEALLDRTEGAIEDKLENICRYRATLKAEAEGAEPELRRIHDFVGGRKKKVKSLGKYMHDMMERLGKTRVQTQHFTPAIQKNSSSSIRWTGDPEEIPEAFKRVEVTVDGPAAHAYYKAHGKLPDGFVVERGTHLRVR